MAGQPSVQPAWTQEEWAALGAFMQAFNQELLDSGELVGDMLEHVQDNPLGNKPSGGKTSLAGV